MPGSMTQTSAAITVMLKDLSEIKVWVIHQRSNQNQMKCCLKRRDIWNWLWGRNIINITNSLKLFP